MILLIAGMSRHMQNQVPFQQESKHWGGSEYAQVSCFTSRADAFEPDEIMRFEYEVTNKIKELGKKSKSNSKTSSQKVTEWTDGYSGKGEITVMNDGASVKGTVYGVGNQFFTLHPLTLLSGGYINTKDVMKDYILIDEEAAWQLFGSNNVVGMSVSINGEKYVVSGVFARPDNRINNASGNGEITFYVNYETLNLLDENAAITDYELIMKNPVPQFVYEFVRKYFLEIDEQGKINSDREIEIIENSDRYSLKHKWQYVKKYGINAMDLNEICYPYWENIAKAYGSIIGICFALELAGIFILVLIIVIDCLMIHKWMKKLPR